MDTPSSLFQQYPKLSHVNCNRKKNSVFYKLGKTNKTYNNQTCQSSRTFLFKPEDSWSFLSGSTKISMINWNEKILKNRERKNQITAQNESKITRFHWQTQFQGARKEKIKPYSLTVYGNMTAKKTTGNNFYSVKPRQW